jgi:hypothetical protein
MRTTITLDADVAAKVKTEMRFTGKSFKETVNSLLRRGVTARQHDKDEPFRVIARPMGERPGLNFDCISDLLEQLEGPFYK